MESRSYQDYGSLKDSSVTPPCLEEETDDERQEQQPRTEGHFLLRFIPAIFFCMTFYCSVIGSFTLFPQYILDRLQRERNFSALLGNGTLNKCLVNQSDPVYQTYLEIQQESSAFLASASFAGGLPSLVSVVILGALSDKLGRKKIIYIAYSGVVFLCVGLMLLINLDLPLWVYFILTFLNGCCGSHGTMFAAIFAHVADVTTEQQRPLVIAIVEMSLGVAMIIVNIVLGGVIKALGFKAPIIGLSVICMLSILFVICIKESAPGTGDTMSTCQVIRTPFARMKMMLLLNRRRSIAIIVLATAFMLYSLILTSGTALSTLYLMGIPFCWNSLALGFFTALKVVFYMIFSFLIIVFLRHRTNNDNLILVGMVSFTISNLVTGVASGLNKPGCDVTMIITIAIGVFSALPGVFIRSQGSKLVSPDEQGAVFGVMSTGETFAFSFGATITNSIYGATVSYLPGLVFYFSAILVFIALVLIVIYKIVAAPLRRALTYSVNIHE